MCHTIKVPSYIYTYILYLYYKYYAWITPLPCICELPMQQLKLRYTSNMHLCTYNSVPPLRLNRVDFALLIHNHISVFSLRGGTELHAVLWRAQTLTSKLRPFQTPHIIRFPFSSTPNWKEYGTESFVSQIHWNGTWHVHRHPIMVIWSVVRSGGSHFTIIIIIIHNNNSFV